MKLALPVLLLAIAAAILLLASGPGTRFELWDFRFGFGMLRWAVYLGGAAVLLALVLLIVPRTRRGSAGTLLAALLIGLVAVGVPMNGVRVARSVPPIHDISTDTERPPAFVDVLPLRGEGSNSTEHGGADLAAQQREAYPDLQTLRLQTAPAQAFDRALAAARAMGWEIVAADEASGRIEATDTTFWFGFKDDVVIRVEAEGNGSRVDVRSVSRVGVSDVGTNARRIRAYLEKLAG